MKGIKDISFIFTYPSVRLWDLFVYLLLDIPVVQPLSEQIFLYSAGGSIVLNNYTAADANMLT